MTQVLASVFKSKTFGCETTLREIYKLLVKDTGPVASSSQL